MELGGVPNKHLRMKTETEVIISRQANAVKELRSALGKIQSKKCWISMGKDVFLDCIAREWIRNQDVFKLEHPNNFLDTAVDIACLWRDGHKITRKEFSLYYLKPQQLHRVRDGLVCGGIDEVEVNSFLKWLCSLKRGDDTLDRPVDTHKLGPRPRFSRKKDKAVINFVRQQEGLYMDRDFVDWSMAYQTEHIEGFHQEFLKERLMKLTSDNLELLEHVDFKDLLNQEKMKGFRNRYAKKNSSDIQETIQTIEMRQNIRKKEAFNWEDYLEWINLFFTGNEDELANRWLDRITDPIDLKSQVQAAVVSKNILKRETLFRNQIPIALSVTASLRTHESMIKDIIQLLLKNENPQTLTDVQLQRIYAKEDVDVYKQYCKDAKKSLFRVFPRVLGRHQVVNNKPLSAMDALVFHYVESWKKCHTKTEIYNMQNYGLEIMNKQNKNKSSEKHLSDRDIERLLGAPPVVPEEWESTEFIRPQPKRAKKISVGYSSMHTLRALTTEEWNRIDSVIFQADLKSKLDDIVTWEKIIHDAKVYTGKPIRALVQEYNSRNVGHGKWERILEVIYQKDLKSNLDNVATWATIMQDSNVVTGDNPEHLMQEFFATVFEDPKKYVTGNMLEYFISG